MTREKKGCGGTHHRHLWEKVGVHQKCSRCGYVNTLHLPVEVRFWDKVDKQTSAPCWIWTGAINNCGYGLFFEGQRKGMAAHRYGWKFSGLTLPEWPQQLDHICRNRLCVNVDHLRIVTSAQNHAARPDHGHCKQGHKFEPGNHKVYKSGKGKKRVCLTCKKAREVAS